MVTVGKDLMVVVMRGGEKLYSVEERNECCVGSCGGEEREGEEITV